MTSEHRAYIGTYPDLRKFASCYCGWKGHSHQTAIAAIKERDQHLEENGADFWAAKAGGDHGTVR